MMENRKVGASGNRDIGKPSFTTETPTPQRENRVRWGSRTRKQGNFGLIGVSA